MATRSSGSDSEGEGEKTLTLGNNNLVNIEKEPEINFDEHLITKTSTNGFALDRRESKTDSESEGAEFQDENEQNGLNLDLSGFPAAIKTEPSSQDEASISANKLIMEKAQGHGPGASLDALMNECDESLESDEAKALAQLDLNLESGGDGDYEEEPNFPPPPRTAPAGKVIPDEDEDSGVVGKDIEMLVHKVRQAGLIAPDARITPKDFKTMGKSSLKPASPSHFHSNGVASARPSTTRPASLNIGSAKQLGSSPSSASGTPKKTAATPGRSRSRPSPGSLKASPVTSDLLARSPQTKGVVSSPDFGSSSLFRPTASASAKYSINNLATTPTGSKAKISKSTSTPTTAKASPKVKMGDAGGGSGEGVNLKDQFAVFSKFGDSASDGKQITLSNCDKWMKQARVIDGKKITTTDTSIAFKKLFKTAKKVNFDEFKSYVEDLSKNKKLDPEEILGKLTNCGAPGLSQATKAAHAGVVDRLTDTSKYTGSHKERFDSTGKGRGIEGRREVKDASGYTAAFKDKLDETKKDEVVSPATH